MNKAKQESVDRLAKKLINRNIYEAIKAAYLGASEKMINELIKICIDKVCQNIYDFRYLKEAKKLAKLRGKELTSREVAPLVDKCIIKGRARAAHIAAKAGGRDLTKKEIKKLKKKNIKKGDLEGIKFIINISGEKLSSGEVDQLIENMHYCTHENIIEAIKLGASQKTIDKFVQKTAIGEWFQRSLEIAALGASKEIIEGLIKFCISKGKILTSIKAAALAGRHLTVKEIKELAARGCWKYIDEALATFDLEKASEKEKKEFWQLVDFLIQDCIEHARLSVVGAIISVTGRELTEEETDRLVGHFAKRGMFAEASRSARLGGRSLKPEEVDILIEKKIIDLNLSSLEFIVEQTNRDLKSEYLERFIERAIDKSWDAKVKEALKIRRRELTISEIDRLVMQGLKIRLSYAVATAEEWGPSQEVIEILISKCIEEGDLSRVVRLSKLLDRELTSIEIEMLADKVCK